jgi:hypothetical protein
MHPRNAYLTFRRIAAHRHSNLGKRRSMVVWRGRPVIIKDKRVLITHTPQSPGFDIIKVADIFTFGGDYAIQVDPSLNPRGWTNIGFIEEAKPHEKLVSWSDKLFPDAEYTSLGPPMYGSEWMDNRRIVPYPTLDIPANALDVTIKLVPERWLDIAKGINMARGPFVPHRADFIRHKENLPQKYFLMILPSMSWGFVDVVEFASVKEIEKALKIIWPTSTAPKEVSIKYADDSFWPISDPANVRIRHLVGKSVNLIVDGREYRVNNGAAVEKYRPSHAERALLSAFSW